MIRGVMFAVGYWDGKTNSMHANVIYITGSVMFLRSLTAYNGNSHTLPLAPWQCLCIPVPFFS